MALAVAFSLLALGACRRLPPAAPVDFPSDPRVLHGAWQLRVTGLYGSHTAFEWDSAAEHIVIWHGSKRQAFEAEGAEDWTEVAAPVVPNYGRLSFDPVLDALVWTSLDQGELTVRTLQLGGDPSEVTFPLPIGYDDFEFAFGSGRVFLVAHAGGSPTLFWWDTLTGANPGELALPNFRDGMLVSRNGRMLSFWDLASYSVKVIDTAAPTELLSLPLGACRGAGMGEASADGRWFLMSDCFANLRIMDLQEPSAGFASLGWKRQGTVRFAADSPEVISLFEDGFVRSYDPVAGVAQVIYELTEHERLDLEAWYGDVQLNRGAQLLALTSGKGLVRLQHLDEPLTFAELPPLPFLEVEMQLAASEIPGLDISYGYAFSGDFVTPGGSNLVTGQVYGGNVHDYVPAGLEPQLTPPQPLTGEGEVTDVLTEELMYRFEFATTDRQATVYLGQLVDLGSLSSYRVELEQVGP